MQSKSTAIDWQKEPMRRLGAGARSSDYEWRGDDRARRRRRGEDGYLENRRFIADALDTILDIGINPKHQRLGELSVDR
jgi:hypothetical protein